jgi:hypothetical protein
VWVGVAVEVAVGSKSKVAVTDWVLFPMLKSHVLPEQFVMPLVWMLQPTKIEPPFAVAVRVPVSLFPSATVQVAVQIVLFAGVVVSDTATLPPPVPAKVIVRFLAASAGPGVPTFRRTAQLSAKAATPTLRPNSSRRGT